MKLLIGSLRRWLDGYPARSNDAGPAATWQLRELDRQAARLLLP